MELGERIRLWRKANELTQQDLAESCDITVSAVSLWESNDSAPSQKHLTQIVDLFDVTMEQFYGEPPGEARKSAKAARSATATKRRKAS